MKNHLIRASAVILLLLALADILSAQSGSWERLPGMEGGDVADIFRSSRGRIFACTMTGGIRYSDDSARMWQGAGPQGIVATKIIEDNRGRIVAAASDGIYRSDDGGERWELLGLAGHRLTAVAADSAGALWAADYQLHRSTDDGRTWTSADPLWGDCSGMLVTPSGRIFVWVFEPYIHIYQIIASDDGVTWKRFSDIWGSAMTLDNAGRLHVSTGKYHLRSADDGVTWDTVAIYPEIMDAAVSMTSVPSGDIFAIMHKSGVVFRSPDGGATWERLNDTLRQVRGICELAPGLLLAGTVDWGVVRSDDAGASWREYNLGLEVLRIRSIICARDGMIFAVSGNEYGPTTLRTTQRAGRRWARITPLFSEQLKAAALLPDGDLLAAGEESVARYDPGSGEWTPLAIDLRFMDLISVDALPDGQVLCMYRGGSLIYSSDTGRTWTTIDSWLATHNLGIITPGGAILIGADAGLARSGDLGRSWHRAASMERVGALASHPNGRLFAGTYIRSSLEAGGVHISDDDGVTWRAAGLGTMNIGALVADRSGAVYAGGDSSLFRTTDGGNTWEMIATFGHCILSLGIDSSGHLCVGTNGAGLFMSRSAVASVDSHSGGETSADAASLALHADGNGLAIGISLPVPGRAVLRLYNLLGEEVARVQDSDLSAGPHRFPLQDAALAVGLYLCRLDVGGASLVRRFVVAR